MYKLPETCSVTEFRDNIAEKIKDLKKSDRPVLLTQNGKAAAIVMSPEEYERNQAEREKAIVTAIIHENQKDIAAGRFKTLDELDKSMRAKFKAMAAKGKKS